MWQYTIAELLYEQVQADLERARREAARLRLTRRASLGVRGQLARALVRTGIRLHPDVAASMLAPAAPRSGRC